MSKVLLINPPISFDEQLFRWPKTAEDILALLGLAYVAAYLEGNGHEVKIGKNLIKGK